MTSVAALIASLDSDLFKALAEPARLQLLRILLEQGGRANVSTIAEHINLDLSVVSRHLKELALVGVLSVERQGRERWYRLNGTLLLERFSEIAAHLRAVMESRPGCC